MPIYFSDRFRLHRCIQCNHTFTPLVLAKDFLDNRKIKTITCPVCGVENLR